MRPAPLLCSIASLIALLCCGKGGATVTMASGSCRTVGEGVEGGEIRPHRPSGEDWREKLVIELVAVVDE